MSQRIRIADRLKSQSTEQLVGMADAIVTGLTNNPAFPSPAFDLKAALTAQAHGGSAARAYFASGDSFGN